MQKVEKKYKGVIVPMVTPFNQELEIDYVAVTKILNKFDIEKVSPFILGTTGESVSVSSSNKLNLVKAVLDNRGRNMLVFAGISSNSLQESINDAEKFALLGIDAVVAHLPFYYPLSATQMLKYFEQLANALPCPLIIYNNPITVKQSIPLEVADNLSHHLNIMGIKDSERGMERLEKSLALWKNRDDFTFLVGWSAQSANSLLNGADGIVPSTGNFVPGMYRKLYDSAIAGDRNKAFELQEKTDYISEIYMKDKNLSQSIPSLKYLMSLYSLCQPYVLPPLYECNADERNRLKQIAIDELQELSGIEMK